MADIGGDSTSMMMGPIDPSAFTGRDEDLFLPGDSLFGFSAAAGMEGNNAPDVGGGECSNPSFPGGSAASLLFPLMASSPLQASSGSFQPSASLPPGPDSAAAGGAMAVRAGKDRGDGSGEGDGTSAAVQPPAQAHSALSLKQSLDAAIVSAAARDAKKAAAAAATAAAAAEAEIVSTKAKGSVRARRRCGGGGGGGGGRKKNKSKGSTGVGGRVVDAGKKATTAAASGIASAVTPRRPARSLRRPRQESGKSNSPVATITAAATAPGLPVAPPVAGASLPAGMELIPGFEDTIDSHFMTALLQRGSDTQPGVSSASASAFASAESQMLAAHNGGGGGPGGEEVVGFGSDAGLSLGFTDALLLGCDTQPSELNAAAAADAKGTPGNHSQSAVPVVRKAAADDGASADGAGVSIARDAGGGDAPLLPPPPGQASPPPLPPTGDILSPAAMAVAAAAAGATSSSLRSSRHPACSSPAAASHPSSVSSSAAPVAAESGVAAATAAAAASPAAASPCGESPTTRVELATASDPGVAKLSTRRKTDKPRRTATATATTTTTTAAAAATAAAAPRRASSGAPPAEEKAAQLADARAVEPASTTETTKTLPKEKAVEPQQEGAGAVPASALPRASGGATARGRVGAAVDGAMQTPAVRRDEVTDRSKQPQAATQPQAKPAPPPLPPSPPPPPPAVVPPSVGSSFSGNAAVVTKGMGTVRFVGQPAGSARPAAAAAAAAAAEAVRGRSPPRQLPRKVSLRFSPRDESTEGKVSERGYLPFQKLTAPLSKPLEAVFKFMVKKWSEVAYSDLNSIRIVFDANAGDTGVPTAAASTHALSQTPTPSANRTVVWGAELSKRPLLDLVSALPGPALDRVCEEQALSLSYTFLTGPIGPPPSRGSAPWDAAPEQEPAVAVRQTLTPTATPRPPPPVVAPTTMGRRQAVVAPRLVAPGCPFSIPGVGGGAVAGGSAAAAAAAAAAAMVAAGGMAWKAPVVAPPQPPQPPPGNFASGSQAMANAVAAAAAKGGGAAGAGAFLNNAPRPSRGGRKGGVQGDTLANATLKKHYKNINRMLQRQGIASPPPLTHFLPGGLFARMHTAAVAGAIGNAAVAAQQALPGRVEVPARASAPGSSAPAAVRRGRQDRIREKQKKQDPPSPDSEEGFQNGADDGRGGGGDGGFEDLGGDASSEEGDDEARGDKASGALMGEETCMALFGGNGVELLVDPSPPGGTGGAVAGVDERAGANVAKPDAAGPQQSSPPLNGGTTATPEAAAAAAAATKPARATSVGVLGKVKVSPLADPPLPRSTSTAVTTTARSAGAPASPPTLMGEETCMALFGGSGVELLVDPSTSPADAGEAVTAAAEAKGEGGEEKHAGLTSASETPQHLGGRGAGEDKGSGRSPAPPALPQKSLPPHTPAAAAAAVAEAGGRASAQPVLPARTVGAVVPSVKAAGVKSTVDGNVPPDSKLVLPSRLDSSAAVVCAGGSTRDDGVEQRTTQPVVRPKIRDSQPLPTTPLGTASAPSTARTVAAPPAAEEPLPETSVAAASAPVETAARSPSWYPPPAPRPVFEMGSLPTRAKVGRPRSPAVPAAATAAAGASSTTRAAAAADERTAQSTGGGTDETPAGLGKHLPPSPEVPVAPPALEPEESGSSTCLGRQPALESAIAAAAATTTDSAGCVVADSEAEVVTPVNGIAPEAAASGSSSCDGGGSGAATVTAPPTPRPAHQSVGTAGTASEAAAAGGAAEDSPQSHPGGSRKLTRSQSNGGDPASSFEGSGGGLSSRPAEAGGDKRSEKPRTNDRCRMVAAAPSAGAPPPPPPPPVVSRVADKNSPVKRRRSGSGEGASKGPRRKRVSPTTAAPGATPSPPPQQQQQLVATPTADALSILAASPAAVSRPFAFASANKAFKERSTPLLLRAGTDPPRPFAGEGTSAGKRPFAGEIAADKAIAATANQPGCRLESISPPTAPGGARGATTTAPGAREEAAVAGSAAGDGASPAVCAAVASPPPAKARRFAFAATAAAAAKKGDRGELLRCGERPTTAGGDASGRGATLSLGTVTPTAPVSNGPFLHPASPPGGDVEGSDSAGGLMSPPRPPPVAVAAREIDSASLSLSMSPEEVQAGYSEAWSSVPSCLWDGAALLGVGEQTVGEGPVTRWLALPNADISLGGSVAAATPTPAPATVAAASVAGPVASGEDCGVGRGEEAAPDTTPPCSSAAPLEGLVQRDEKQSSWASFCAAFTSSRGSAGPAAASATSSGPRAAGEARSLPTLIRLGRSMTKGVSPVEDDDKPAGKGDGAGVEPAAAAAAAMGNGSKASAAGVAAAAGALVSAPAATATAAESTPTASGTVRSASLAVDCNDGGGKDSVSSETLSGSRRKRDGGAGSSGDGGLGCNSDEGGEGAAAAAATAAAVAPTALPKRRSKKKGRIAPTFVSTLPHDSFGTLTTAFSSNRRV